MADIILTSDEVSAIDNKLDNMKYMGMATNAKEAEDLNKTV